MFYFLFFFKIHLQRLIPIIKVKGLTYNLTRARLYYAQPLCCWSWLWRAGHFDNNSNRIWPAISNLKLIVQRMTLAHAHIEKYLSRETWIHPLAIIDNYVPVMPCRCRSFFFLLLLLSAVITLNGNERWNLSVIRLTIFFSDHIIFRSNILLTFSTVQQRLILPIKSNLHYF
jgi:hypothetical protein